LLSLLLFILEGKSIESEREREMKSSHCPIISLSSRSALTLLLPSFPFLLCTHNWHTKKQAKKRVKEKENFPFVKLLGARKGERDEIVCLRNTFSIPPCNLEEQKENGRERERGKEKVEAGRRKTLWKWGNLILQTRNVTIIMLRRSRPDRNNFPFRCEGEKRGKKRKKFQTPY
jgi:hypothetical protein